MIGRLVPPWLLAMAAAPALVACGGVDHRPAAPSGQMSSMTVTDGRHDLWTVYGEPGRVIHNSDAVGADLRRTSGAVLITVHYDEIRPHANREWGVEFALNTGGGVDRTVEWGEYRYAGTRRWAREVDFDRLTTEDSLGGRCPGLEGSPDFTAQTVTVRVPARCFGNAPWVVVKDLAATSYAWGRYAPHFYDYLGTAGDVAPRSVRLVAPT